MKGEDEETLRYKTRWENTGMGGAFLSLSLSLFLSVFQLGQRYFLYLFFVFLYGIVALDVDSFISRPREAMAYVRPHYIESWIPPSETREPSVQIN